MNTRIVRACSAIALVALVAGCGGGGSQHSVIPTKSAARGSASVGLHVVIPKKSASAAKRVVKHLPSSTKSMAVTVNGGTPQVVGLQSTDPGCSVDPGTGNTVCNATILAPIGSDTFDLTAYDAAGGTGNVLSHANVTKTVVAGTNNFPITLGGVVASVTLSVASPVYEGAATTTATANVVAADADGNTIMDAYDQTVTVTGSGTFAGTSGTVAQSGDTISLVYDGTDPANVGPTTFTAAAGSTAVTLTATSPLVSNPKNLATSVALWYDAADASSIATDGTTTFTWKDKSGNAKDVASSGTPLPTYPDTAVRDAKHALVDFTPGTPASAGPPAVPATPGAFLSRLDGFPGGDYSVFAVAYNTRADSSGSSAGGSPGAIVGGGIGTTAPNGHALLLTDPGTLCLYEANADCTAVTVAIASVNPSFANTLYRVTGTANSVANTGTLAINGATGAPGFASGAMPARTVDPSVVINGFNNDGLTSGTNSIAEVVVLDHVASATEQTAIEAYLKAKWTLP
jgi:hypothetical protein